jgi:hypothetical protein
VTHKFLSEQRRTPWRASDAGAARWPLSARSAHQAAPSTDNDAREERLYELATSMGYRLWKTRAGYILIDQVAHSRSNCSPSIASRRF